MHKEVKMFVKSVRRRHPWYFFRSRVLEVGSMIINGSIRKQFFACRYKGIDLAPGPGVDLVHDMSNPGYWGLFDVVISLEVLEHAQKWRTVVKNMYDCVKPGGLLIITCAGPARAEHGTERTDAGSSPHTNGYYENIGLEDLSMYVEPHQFKEYYIAERRDRMDLVFYGIKN
jgi:SAM-dependent methyltransferase